MTSQFSINKFNVSLASLGLLAFWFAVFVINAGPHWEVYVSNRELVETAGLVTLLQAAIALVCVRVLAPKLLDFGKTWQFCGYVFLLICLASYVQIVVRFFYLEPTYPLSYKGFLSVYGDMSFLQRADPRWTMRYILFTKVPLLIFPSMVILAHDYYRKQQLILRLREQKRTAELDALKNQLNPHFIFNTLNNIYALALKKSDQTPVAIEKLSGILDYVVYRCSDKYVSLEDEVTLIENYIALEKIRYGKRLQVELESRIQGVQKIAPLLLLTLVENACKHGTQEELNQAKVGILITADQSEIRLVISNSKPTTSSMASAADQNRVGLVNLSKQLELLYPDQHRFEILDQVDRYVATLTLSNSTSKNT